MNEEDLIAALYKRAMGFNAEDSVEEYMVSDDSGRMELTKKKTNIKYIPPDISAVKTVLEYLRTENDIDPAYLSDEELDRRICEIEEELKKQKEETDED